MGVGLPMMERQSINACGRPASAHVGTGALARPVERSSTWFFASYCNEDGIMCSSHVDRPSLNFTGVFPMLPSAPPNWPIYLPNNRPNYNPPIRLPLDSFDT